MDDEFLPDDLIDEPLDVKLLGEAVVLLGPDGIALSITAHAAEESARRLNAAARRARKNAGDRVVRAIRLPPRRRA